MTIKVYVAGPITGYPDGNAPAFAAAAAWAREQGYETISPIEMDTPEELAETLADHYGKIYWERLAEDLKVVAVVDALILLPKWSDSKGARIEAFIAVQAGKEFYAWTGRDAVSIPKYQVTDELCWAML